MLLSSISELQLISSIISDLLNGNCRCQVTVPIRAIINSITSAHSGQQDRNRGKKIKPFVYVQCVVTLCNCRVCNYRGCSIYSLKWSIENISFCPKVRPFKVGVMKMKSELQLNFIAIFWISNPTVNMEKTCSESIFFWISFVLLKMYSWLCLYCTGFFKVRVFRVFIYF